MTHLNSPNRSLKRARRRGGITLEWVLLVTVLIIGTGLTMVDVALKLAAEGQKGRPEPRQRTPGQPRVHPTVRGAGIPFEP